MNWYAIIKRYYTGGYYTAEQVQIFVNAGKITTEQAAEIISAAA